MQLPWAVQQAVAAMEAAQRTAAMAEEHARARQALSSELQALKTAHDEAVAAERAVS